jgi:hypothetical protein
MVLDACIRKPHISFAAIHFWRARLLGAAAGAYDHAAFQYHDRFAAVNLD